MVSLSSFSDKDDAHQAAVWKVSEFLREIATFGAEDRLYSHLASAGPLHVVAKVVAKVVADFCRVNCKKSNKIIGLHGLA